MDYYSVDEDTPLIRSLATHDASPRSDLTLTLTPQALFSSGISSSSRRSFQTTELELSVDKISSLFNPSTSEDTSNGHVGNYMSFANVSLNKTIERHDELNMLDPYFDVTPSRLRVAFEGAGPEGERELSYEGFRAALETLGIRCSDSIVFLKLVENIDREKRGHITLAQFDAAVHRLKLMHMLEEHTLDTRPPASSPQPSSSLSVSDFSSTKLQSYTLRPETLPNFFLTSRPEWIKVRWINLTRRDSGNLKRLAIKYRLHPLAIEDTIEGHERPKFDRYDGHLFLVFPVLRMRVMPDQGFPFEADDMVPSTTQKSPFRRGSSFSRKMSLAVEDTEEEKPLRLWIEHVFIFIIENETVITIKDGGESDLWGELNRRLAVPYSKLRHNDATFLVHSVLDVIVDQVTHVVDSITECLMQLEIQLDQARHRFEFRSLRVLKNELVRLPRLLKPAREVLKNIIESRDFDAIVTDYVRDVHDHVVQVLDDIDMQLQMCRQLTDEYRDAKATQMNYVIYTLTVVTTVFLPGQFLTGVYGMNFDDMPELHQRYGYAFFWVLAIAIAVALQLYFRYKEWI